MLHVGVLLCVACVRCVLRVASGLRRDGLCRAIWLWGSWRRVSLFEYGVLVEVEPESMSTLTVISSTNIVAINTLIVLRKTVIVAINTRTAASLAL